jgi:endoplasmic reticulum resident protein 44
VQEFKNLNEVSELDDKKRYMIGYFDTKECREYETFRRVATNLKDDCTFIAGFGEVPFIIKKLPVLPDGLFSNRKCKFG